MSSVTPSPTIALGVRAVTTRGVRVPLTFVLGTSAAIVRAVPLLLVEVLMEEGVVGRAYVFCYSSSGAKAIAEHIVEAVELAKGQPAKPQAIFKMLSRRFALLGVTGPVRMALSTATPTAHWIEYVDWADAILEEPLVVADSTVVAPDRPGLGIAWSEQKLRRLENI